MESDVVETNGSSKSSTELNVCKILSLVSTILCVVGVFHCCSGCTTAHEEINGV